MLKFVLIHEIRGYLLTITYFWKSFCKPLNNEKNSPVNT